jgi:hypothetical protein
VVSHVVTRRRGKSLSMIGMGKRFDPMRWPQTARTRWRNWRTRDLIVPLGSGTVIDQDGTESESEVEDVIGHADVYKKRRLIT